MMRRASICKHTLRRRSHRTFILRLLPARLDRSRGPASRGQTGRSTRRFAIACFQLVERLDAPSPKSATPRWRA